MYLTITCNWYLSGYRVNISVANIYIPCFLQALESTVSFPIKKICFITRNSKMCLSGCYVAN